jgi:hypothetical protein
VQDIKSYALHVCRCGNSFLPIRSHGMHCSSLRIPIASIDLIVYIDAATARAIYAGARPRYVRVVVIYRHAR